MNRLFLLDSFKRNQVVIFSFLSIESNNNPTGFYKIPSDHRLFVVYYEIILYDIHIQWTMTISISILCDRTCARARSLKNTLQAPNIHIKRMSSSSGKEKKSIANNLWKRKGVYIHSIDDVNIYCILIFCILIIIIILVYKDHRVHACI